MENKKQITEKFNEIERVVSDESNQIPDRIYSALEGISSMILAYMKNKGADGWTQTLVKNDGTPLFSSENSSIIEAHVKNMEPLIHNVLYGTKNVLQQNQSGGADGASIDAMYYGLMSTLDSYDKQWKETANGLGAVKAFSETDQVGVIPFTPPIPYIIPAKLKFPLINTILELLRLMVSNQNIDMPRFRVLLSFGIAMVDLLRGEWQHGVMSLLGAYSKDAMYFGIMGKVVRDAWLLITPDLRIQLSDTLFKSTKSMGAGFLLWAFSTFAPNSVRMAIQGSLDKIQEPIENYNKQMEEVEKKLSGQTGGDAVINPPGIVVKFKKINASMIPSLEDIQKLQTMGRIPGIVCSNEFQKIIEPLLLIPPLRLVLELFNIPTTAEAKKEVCAGIPQGPISNTVAEMITPEVSILPGGQIDQAQKMAEQAKAIADNPMGSLPKVTLPLPKVTLPLPKVELPKVELPKVALPKPTIGGNKKNTRKNKRVSM